MTVVHLKNSGMLPTLQVMFYFHILGRLKLISVMITAKIQYQGELRTQCTHVQSGSGITTDAPVDNFGKGEAFSPTDLLSTSLVSCMLTTMGIAATKNNIPFTKADAEMTKVMAKDPRRVSSIIVTIKMPKTALTAEQKEILEAAAVHCPVAKSLHPDLDQQVRFEY
jgi:putative redox protein